MDKKLTKEKTERRDRLIKYLGAALTNSALYSATHPAFNLSIKSFKDILDICLAGEEKIELGISPDIILFNGAFVKEKNEPDSKVADYLHKRGIIAVSFKRGIEMAELIEFFAFLKDDAKTISAKGGIIKNIGSMPHIIIKEIFELFTEKLTADHLSNERIAAEVKNALYAIGGRETVDALLSFIPKAAHETLDHIAYVLAKTGDYPAGALLDSFIKEPDKSNRNNFGYVLSKMGGNISKKIGSGIEDAAVRGLSPVVKDLYAILKRVDPSEARAIAKKMMGYGNADIRMQALEGFSPNGEEEINNMFKMFQVEKDRTIKKIILANLVKIRRKGDIDGPP